MPEFLSGNVDEQLVGHMLVHTRTRSRKPVSPWLCIDKRGLTDKIGASINDLFPVEQIAGNDHEGIPVGDRICQLFNSLHSAIFGCLDLNLTLAFRDLLDHIPTIKDAFDLNALRLTDS